MDTAVKFVKGSDTLIEGLAIPFSGPIAGKDLDGEDFGPDTDLALDWFPQGRPVLYHHGVDGAMKTAVQGRQSEQRVTDEGVWAQAVLDKSAKYHATVARLVTAGKLFFSSGSMPHLVEMNPDGHITRWPWIELSLTPTPSNPFATVHTVKATDLIEHLAAASLPVPSELIAAALKALDSPDDPDALPDGAKFTDLLDRLTADGVPWVRARKDWYGKSGRVLSAATRERLIAHPSTLRQLADDLDELLAAADAPKEAKSADWAIAIQAELRRARDLGTPIQLGVTIP